MKTIEDSTEIIRNNYSFTVQTHQRVSNILRFASWSVHIYICIYIHTHTHTHVHLCTYVIGVFTRQSAPNWPIREYYRIVYAGANAASPPPPPLCSRRCTHARARTVGVCTCDARTSLRTVRVSASVAAARFTVAKHSRGFPRSRVYQRDTCTPARTDKEREKKRVSYVASTY